MIAFRKEAEMKVARVVVAAVLVVCACSLFAQNSTEEQAVWKLEQAYWEDVKAADMASYLALWHQDFVGWPVSGAKPVRKDHIGDWLRAYTAKGLHLKKYVLEAADSQTTKNIVVTQYWLTTDWADNDGHEQWNTIRITHTWIHSSKGWLILGGMSSSEEKVRN
jgi:hypothetical protein